MKQEKQATKRRHSSFGCECGEQPKDGPDRATRPPFAEGALMKIEAIEDFARPLRRRASKDREINCKRLDEIAYGLGGR
jgi:hypothetical protein